MNERKDRCKEKFRIIKNQNAVVNQSLYLLFYLLELKHNHISQVKYQFLHISFLRTPSFSGIKKPNSLRK